MIAEIKGALDAVKTLIGLAREQNSISEDRKTAAIGALMKAITATRRYTSAPLVRKGTYNHQAEEELTHLWIDAAEAVRPIDSALADRCFMKAYGWADRVQFDSPEFQLLNLGLDEMSKEIRLLIRDQELPILLDENTAKTLTNEQ